MKNYYFGLWLLWVWGAAQSQTVITVSKIPALTPVLDTIFVAGNFNGWNPGDKNFRLIPQSNGTFSVTIPPTGTTLEFKFTRGSWKKVESDAQGKYMPNRTAQDKPQTLVLQILGWEDLGGSQGSTASKNVSLLSASFAMPQLGRMRRIWLYLPADYFSSQKRYPVLYMHDGQNLFDAATSFAGEWGVDEALDILGADIIVVGIDNGGASRLSEYSPWPNPRYGGGEGDEYLEFIVRTLKPFVDSNFRTRPEQEYTGIMGSSMGGLISYYGLLKYPSVFSRAGIFSPAFWFNQEIFAFADTVKRRAESRIYFLCGLNEDPTMEPNMKSIYDKTKAAGYSERELFYRAVADGTHSESFWRQEFPAAVRWLYRDSLVAALPRETENATIQTYYGSLYINVQNQPLEVTLFDISGRKVMAVEMAGGGWIVTEGLPYGLYLVKISCASGIYMRRVRLE